MKNYIQPFKKCSVFRAVLNTVNVLYVTLAGSGSVHVPSAYSEIATGLGVRVPQHIQNAKTSRRSYIWMSRATSGLIVDIISGRSRHVITKKQLYCTRNHFISISVTYIDFLKNGQFFLLVSLILIMH